MRRFTPAVLALTLGLVACNPPSVPQSAVPAASPVQAPTASEQIPAAPLTQSPAETAPGAATPTPVPAATPETPAPASTPELPAPAPVPAPTPVQPPVTAPAPVDSAPETPSSVEEQSLKPTTYGGAVTVKSGTMQVGGKTMFPFGFYHVSWMSDAATRKRDMLEMSAAGFNTMTASVINDDDSAHYGDFLDAAAKAKMYVMTEGLPGENIRAVAHKPSVLAWMVADDCNLNFKPQDVSRLSNAVKSVDPSHPTYAALFTTYDDAHEAFFDTTNMMGNMSYPIGPGDSIGATYDMERLSVKASARSGTVPIANLQTFSWGTVPGHDTSARMPTPEEVYNMTYQAIAAGAKGILYYTYIDSYNSVRRSPAVWNMVKSIVPEIGKISPIILNAAPQYLETNNGSIHATLWKYQNHSYLLVTNVSPNQAQQLYIPLKAYAPSQLSPMFTGRGGSGVKLTNQTLSGNIAPLAAHFYKIN